MHIARIYIYINILYIINTHNSNDDAWKIIVCPMQRFYNYHYYNTLFFVSVQYPFRLQGVFTATCTIYPRVIKNKRRQSCTIRVSLIHYDIITFILYTHYYNYNASTYVHVYILHGLAGCPTNIYNPFAISADSCNKKYFSVLLK